MKMRNEGRDIVFELAQWEDQANGRGFFLVDGLDILKRIMSNFLRERDREHSLKVRQFKSQARKKKERENWKSYKEIFGSHDEFINAIIQSATRIEFRVKMTPELKKQIEFLQQHNFQEELR